jgi:hypothetical protein
MTEEKEEEENLCTVRYNPRICLVGLRQTNFAQINVSEGTGLGYHKFTKKPLLPSRLEWP